MKKIKALYPILGLIALSLPMPSQSPGVEKIIDKNVITVATYQSPSTLYNYGGESFGLEYALAKRFSQSLGVHLHIKPYTNINDIYRAVEQGEADFAAANLTPEKIHYKTLRVSIPYQQAETLLISRASQSSPQSLAELSSQGARIFLSANSLNNDQFNKFQSTYQHIQWTRSPYTNTDYFLDELSKGQLDYVVLNSTDYELYRPLYPELKAGLKLTEPQAFRWVFSKRSDDSLFIAAHNFLSETLKNDEVKTINDQLYAHLDKFNVANAKTFQEHIKSRLPAYKDSFEKAAEKYHFDWRLLAAISYQESTWNPQAVSPTGVRGLMMLTQKTARELGVTNRKDPNQSIFGGAAYLRKLVDREPDTLGQNQKIWFSLAAYNAGYGMVMDARRLAKKQGIDPYNWQLVKGYLANLPGRYHNKYVANIRRYYELLLWATMTEHPTLTQINSLHSPATQPFNTL